MIPKLDNKRYLSGVDMEDLLVQKDIKVLIEQVPNWELVEGREDGRAAYIRRHWRFSSYRESVKAVTIINQLAEREQQFPFIEFGEGYLLVKLMTTAVDGLTISDFAMAIQINRLVP